MNLEESMSITNDPEEGNLEDKTQSSIGRPMSSARTYVSQLRIWNGTYSQDGILRIFLRPFPFVLSPVVGHLRLFFIKNFKTPIIDLVCVLCIWNADCVVK